MGSNAKQHYVPQFLLRGFGAGNRKQLTAFDKQEEREFKLSIRDAAGERSFYDITSEDHTASFETALSELEDKASPILSRIRTKQIIFGLTAHDRRVVSTFVAVQLMRTPNYRTSVQQISETLAKHVAELETPEGDTIAYPSSSVKDAKRLSLTMLADAPKYAPLLETKSWILFRNLTTIPFMISDNPVTLQNLQRENRRGSLGIGVPGIEIYLPLNSHLTLCMLCSSYESASRFALGAAAAAPGLYRSHGIEPASLHQLVAGIDKGTAVDCRPEHVMNLNSLQVMHAERFLYAANNKPFALAREMIADDMGYRSGPRIELA